MSSDKILEKIGRSFWAKKEYY